MKKIFALLTTAILLITMTLPVMAAEEIPTTRMLPRLVDDGDLLSDAEEQQLLTKLNEISERQECDVVIATVNTLGNKSSEAFADDYFDYNGYGMGNDRAGIILVVCMEYRDYAISTCGYGITAFTDAGISYMEERFLPDLSAGNYASSFNKFADLSDDLLTQARQGTPYDVSVRQVERQPVRITPGLIIRSIIISYLVGLALAFGIASGKRRALRTVAKKTSAGTYLSQFNLTHKSDRYINSTTSSHTVSKASQSSGGGSSIHTSSSGSFHGGHSGKF